jgi:hypothetical protein
MSCPGVTFLACQHFEHRGLVGRRSDSVGLIFELDRVMAETRVLGVTATS